MATKGKSKAIKLAVKEHKASVIVPQAITKIYQEAQRSGSTIYRVLLGYSRQGKQRKVSLGTGRKFADSFVKSWNQSLQSNDTDNLSLLQESSTLDVRYANNKLRPFGVTLREAVDYYVKHQLPAGRVLPFSGAMDKYYEIQKDKKLSRAVSSKQSSTYKTYFKPLVDFFGSTFLTDITASDVKRYLKKRGNNWSDLTYNHHLNRGRQFWNVLAKQKYCKADQNPWGDDMLPRKVVKRTRMSLLVMPPEDVQKWLWHAEVKAERDKMFYRELAALTLTFFCGVRVEEVGRLEWIDIGQGHKRSKTPAKDETSWRVTVWADVEKTNRTKIVFVPDNAKHWLSKCLRVAEDYGWKKIVSRDVKQRLKRMRARFKLESGVSIPQNSARHCFCNYHLSEHNSLELTVQRLNHGSVNTMRQNYMATQDPDLSEKFFEIYPRETHDKQQLEKTKAYKMLMAKKGVEGKQEIEFFTSLRHGHEKCWVKFFTSKGVEEFVAQDAWDEGSALEHNGLTYKQSELATLVKFNRYKQTVVSEPTTKRQRMLEKIGAKFSFKDVVGYDCFPDTWKIMDAVKMLSIDDFIVENVGA